MRRLLLIAGLLGLGTGCWFGDKSNSEETADQAAPPVPQEIRLEADDGWVYIPGDALDPTTEVELTVQSGDQMANAASELLAIYPQDLVFTAPIEVGIRITSPGGDPRVWYSEDGTNYGVIESVEIDGDFAIAEVPAGPFTGAVVRDCGLCLL